MFVSVLPGFTIFIFIGLIILILYKLFPVEEKNRNKPRPRKI